MVPHVATRHTLPGTPTASILGSHANANRKLLWASGGSNPRSKFQTETLLAGGIRGHRNRFVIVMPGGMNGRQLADEVLRLRPDMKVLFTTGYTRNAIVHHGRLDPGVTVVSKPFSQRELREKVRSILDKR